MKILHITTVPCSLAIFAAQIDFLRSQKIDVEVLAAPGPELERFAIAHSVPAHAVRMERRITPLSDLVALYRIWRVIRRIRPDVVHASTPKAGLLGTLAAWCAGVPARIFHIHGLPHLAARGLRKVLLSWSTCVACKFASQVLCVSSSVANVAIKAGLCLQRNIVVPRQGSAGGVDASSRFYPGALPSGAREAMRRCLGIPAGAMVVGYVGRIVRDKGIGELVEAWKQLEREFPTVYLALAGPFEPEDPVPSGCREYLLSHPRIVWRSWIDNMPEFYAALDLLALPSYREGFGNVILEAGAMSLPVIASRVPGLIDSVVDGITGTLFEVRDALALAEAIRFYILNPEQRVRHGRFGRARALLDFRPEPIWREYLAIYRNLMDHIVPRPETLRERVS